MNDEIDENPPGEESFAELFEASMKETTDNLRVGDRIEGRIIAIGGDSVYVDTGTKVDGVVEKHELTAESGEFAYHVGDTLELYVTAGNESEIRLSRAMSGIGGLNMLQDAKTNGVPVEGKVAGICKGGFEVTIMQRRAFCPISQMDLKFVEKPEEYVGNTYPFLISRIEEQGRNIVVSRKMLLEREVEAIRREFLEHLAVGQVLDGLVVKLMPFGAFVELCPGLEGMVHISEISWSRVEKPEEILTQGQNVRVKVIALEPKEGKKGPRVGLSIKQAQGDPWASAAERFHAGETIEGRVTRCAPFGAFVEIAPGIEGMVHISEMSFVKRIVHPEDVVKPGEVVSVAIKDINLDNRRISLSLRDATGDPWATVSEKYKPGQFVEGTLEKKEAFGYFIQLEPGITGLLPKSRIAGYQDPASIEKIKPGQPIRVTVEEIHPQDRKITLGLGDKTQDSDWKQFTRKESGGMGTLAEKLQAALNAGK